MKPSERNLSIDIFKGFGLIYMIIAHQIIFLFTRQDGFGLLFSDSYKIFSFFRLGLHPLSLQFPTLAGASFFFLVHSKQISLLLVLKRSVLLIFLGFLSNYLAWGASSALSWDILQFIGLCTIVSYFFVKNFDKIRYRISLIAIGAFCLLLSNKFPFLSYKDLYIYKIFFGDAQGQNYWPFCPWYSLFISGIFLGYLLNLQNKKLLKSISVIGIFLFISYIIFELKNPSAYFTKVYDFENVWGSILFKPSPIFVVGIIGFGLGTIPFSHLLLSQNALLRNLLKKSFLMEYAQGILWIYIITIIFGYRISALFTMNLKPTYQKSLLMLPALVFLNLLLSYAIGKIVSLRKRHPINNPAQECKS